MPLLVLMNVGSDQAWPSSLMPVVALLRFQTYFGAFFVVTSIAKYSRPPRPKPKMTIFRLSTRVTIFGEESTKNWCEPLAPGVSSLRRETSVLGTKAHCSAPVASSKACSMPSLAPTRMSASVAL